MAQQRFCWKVSDLQEAVKGSWSNAVTENEGVFSSVSTDSRSLSEGALYIAIVGERFDGHDFICQAVAKGAAVVLVSNPQAKGLESLQVPVLTVADTRIALGQFAQWHRNAMPLKKLVAITGSNGKTTTKTLLARLLQKQVGEDKVCFTQGNLNNDFGVPRTLLTLRPYHEYAVIEMGANHLHEIQYLTRLACPDVALITLAAGAHLEGFGSLEGVIEAKGEIFEGLKPSGIGIVNLDSPGADKWTDKLRHQGNAIMTFAQQQQAQVTVGQVSSDRRGISFECHYQGNKAQIHMPILGPHNAMNAAAAMTTCLALGFEWTRLLPGLVDFQGVSGRVQQYDFRQGVLIDDSYNANPSSVRAAIDTLVNLKEPCVLCLGAMAELGEESAQAHREVIEYAKQKKVTYVCLYGEALKSLGSVFGENAEWFSTHNALAEKVLTLQKQGKIVHCLVKGSRSSQMEKVTDYILENLAPASD